MKSDSVLARLAASWGISSAAPITADVAALQAEFDAFKLQAESDLKEVSAALEAAVNLSKEVEAERDALAEKLAAMETATAEAAAQAAAAKVKARKEKLVAVLGTERANAVFEATSQMTDENFEAVVAAMTVSATVEAKSPLFTESGVDAEAKAPDDNAPSQEMQILRNKYAAGAA